VTLCQTMAIFFRSVVVISGKGIPPSSDDECLCGEGRAAPTGPEELVPSGLQGTWGQEGKCAVRSARLVLTATSAQFGLQQSCELRFFPNGNGLGNGEFLTADGTWLAPQYEPTKDVMIWTEKSGRTTYRRCRTPP